MTRRPPLLRLASAERGTAAVELALVMAVILLLFLACVDVGRMLSWSEQARTAMINSADAASAAASPTTSLTNAILTQIMQGQQAQATSGIWSSNPVSNGLIMTILASDANGKVTIVSQAKYPSTFTGASTLGCHAGATPAGFSGVQWEAGDMFIACETWFTYTPFSFAGAMLNNTGTQSTHDMFVFRPRQTPPSTDKTGTC